MLAAEKVTVYNGFDPTANSLHIGNLVPMMGLARLQRYGHTPIALAGGGTGLIGDPSGRETERQLLNRDEVEANLAAIKEQLARLLDFEVRSNPARIVDNAEWLLSLSMMDFLRDVGKAFTVNYMLAKESVRSRLEREDGISFTEFSYMLLQAYDYLHLHDRLGCRLQAGGSDQWGNITAGVQLIRKLRGARVHGLAYPLITLPSGQKFGKTGTGTVWLAAARTSPFRFYQFWLNSDDADVIPYLKMFTWLSETEIADLADKVATQPERREAQRALAAIMTRTIHGETALARAQQASEVLFGGPVDGLAAGEIADIFADVPSSRVTRPALSGEGLPIVDLLVRSGLARSRGEARRAIDGGGVYLNNIRVAETGHRVTGAECLDGAYLILRHGKKRYHLVQVQD